MRSRPTPVKQNPYESGMPPLGEFRDLLGEFASELGVDVLPRVVASARDARRFVAGTVAAIDSTAPGCGAARRR